MYIYDDDGDDADDDDDDDDDSDDDDIIRPAAIGSALLLMYQLLRLPDLLRPMLLTLQAGLYRGDATTAEEALRRAEAREGSQTRLTGLSLWPGGWGARVSEETLHG